MKLTKERVQEISSSIALIRCEVFGISEEELDELIKIGSQEEAIGPLLDPTKWRDEDLFGKTAKTLEVLRMIKELKRRLEHETTKT